MPEISKVRVRNFTEAAVDLNTVQYRDKDREKDRQVGPAPRLLPIIPSPFPPSLLLLSLSPLLPGVPGEAGAVQADRRVAGQGGQEEGDD